MTRPKDKRAILVVGATGNIGSALTRALIAKTDYFVTIVVRDKQKAEGLFSDVITKGRMRLCISKQLLSKDLLDAMQEIDIAVWCVGPKSRSRLLDLISLSPDSPKSVDYLAVQQLVESVKQSTTLQRIIIISPPEVDRPYRPMTIFKNLSQSNIYYWKAIGESLVKGSGLDYTIIRPHCLNITERTIHRPVSEISFHQKPTSFWKTYPGIPLGSLIDVLCETIERPDRTSRTTFEMSGQTSQASVWDDLFDKLEPDQETKSKANVISHRVAIGIGVVFSMAFAAGITMAGIKYMGYDQRIGMSS